MPALARPLFFAAWVCPTIALLFGELPVVRIIAAVLAAMLSGAASSTLPPAGFRVARLITCLIFPLSWLWVGYVTLNGNGPTAIECVDGSGEHQLVRGVHGPRVDGQRALHIHRLLQASLLAASYLSGTTRFGRPLRAMLAAALVAITTCAWAQLLLDQGAAFMPTRQDWREFPLRLAQWTSSIRRSSILASSAQPPRSSAAFRPRRPSSSPSTPSSLSAKPFDSIETGVL